MTHKINLAMCPACQSIGKNSNLVGEIVCPCESQKEWRDRYLKANIPYEYWFLDIEDFKGGSDHKRKVVEYCEHIDNAHYRGLGLFLSGKNGTGKSLLAVSILKQAIRKGYTGFFASYADITSMFTSTWRSDTAKATFEKAIENSDFLVIDDLGKEYKTQNNIAESVLDRVIRYRRYPIIITANRNVADLQTFYGGSWGESLASLIYGKMIQIFMYGTDYRKDMSSKLMETLKETPYRSLK